MAIFLTDSRPDLTPAPDLGPGFTFVTADITAWLEAGVPGVEAQAMPWHDQPFSAELTLPPLGAVWFVPE